jgi:hypothetical protein
MTVDDACEVLSVTLQRGYPRWQYDRTLMRIVPSGWHSPEPAPTFTVFEALAVGRALVAIHADRAGGVKCD